ncbi:hypothetical protein CROQUDRAFT_131903 [Cronartium quercuum f. sp. fusiforme G11]|uniref:Uncharacterized protein n=1 Tax=Cronartium quercuum f. sp. fusiforme G11 TaxID=708437 RepID=A0A9P6NRP9_9BASI|nr:hypothetical protein CROQUDRAFT_131903 [Cronartium quercuum f. sp. fusiforme G11]
MSLSASLDRTILQIRSASVMPTNPFEGILEEARKKITPIFPAWTLDLLIASAVWRAIIILSCIAIMLIPAVKGAASRKKHYFLFRAVYPVESARIPYLVPNRCMVITFTELFSSALYLASACLNYRLYSETPMPRGTNITVWYGLACVSLFSSFNYSFGFEYIWALQNLDLMLAWILSLMLSISLTCGWLPSRLVSLSISVGHEISELVIAGGDENLCDPEGLQQNRSSKILTPLVYNSIWLSWCFLVTVVTFYWAILAAEGHDQLDPILLGLLSMLEQASDSWAAHQDVSRIPVAVLFQERDILLGVLNKLARSVGWWARTWFVMATGLGIFYLLVVRYLLRILRRVLVLGEADSLARGQLARPIWSELEQEFRFLSKSSICILICIGCQILVVIYQSLSSTHLELIHWRQGSALFSQLPGIFMAPSLLIQSWRILTERQVANESDFYHIQENFNENKMLPVMTSQLLGWDTTMFWGREANIEIGNFPGLCPVLPDMSLSDSDHQSLSTQKTECSHTNIKVTCTTMISEDRS